MSGPSSRSDFAWLKPIARFFVAVLVILGIARLLLAGWQWQRFDQAADLLWVMAQGVRFDLMSLGYLLVLPLAATPFLLLSGITARIWSSLLGVYLLVVLGLFVFMEVSTPEFIKEYDLRPNYLFPEFIRHPREVFSMLLAAYRLPLLITAIAVPLIVWAGYRFYSRDYFLLGRARMRPLAAVFTSFLILVAGFAVIRSSTGHRPANASTVVFSDDALLNTLPLNSLYTVVSAIRETSYEVADFPYGDFDRDAVVEHMKALMYLPEEAFVDPAIPTLHRQQATFRLRNPKNLVIVLEESLGSEFVGSLGGLPLTPNLDAMADEGIWFERLYATGTRSVRGIEAIITGFLPSSSLSVVKLPRSQSGFFTLAELLSARDYDTSFIYGGSADFDNMRRFFSNNGFNTVIDQADYAEPIYTASWGVSDEDLFNKAHEYFTGKSAAGERFFSLVFSSTNHSPFEYPDGRIEQYDAEKYTVNNAVKYADYAMGRFIDTARQSDYWDDTLFLVISDHNSRVYGQELVPIERFHIPGVILGKDVEPVRVQRIVSQVDMIPTLLSLMGIDAEHPAVGYDLTREDVGRLPGRAVMQFGGNQAYLKGRDVVILQKDLPPRTFTYEGGTLVEAAGNEQLVEEAITLSAWPYISYREGTYRLPQ